MNAKTKSTAAATDDAADAATGRGAAECAALVQRVVLHTQTIAAKDGKPAETIVSERRTLVKASEVLDYRDYGSHVVVVTTDGQKLDSRDAAPAGAKA